MRLLLGKRWRYLYVVLIYLALSILLTYPLITKITTHVVGSNIDEGSFIWNIWWVKYSIVDLHSSPLFTDYIFYPLGVSTVYYTLTLLNGLLTIPLQLFASPILVNNLVLLFSLTTSAFGAFLLSNHVLTNHFQLDRHGETITGSDNALRKGILFASFVAGLIYAFPASRFVYAALGQANLTSTGWIPFFALFLIRSLEDPTPENSTKVFSVKRIRYRAIDAVFAGICLLFATLTELTYAAFLALFAALYFCWIVIDAEKKIKTFISSLIKLAIMGITFLIGFSPILPDVLHESTQDGDYLSNTWGGADRFSADLLSFFTPTQLHPIFGQLSKQWTAGFTDIPIVYIGFSVIVLSLVASFAYRRRVGFWIGSSLSFLILILGPILHIDGISDFDFDGLHLDFGLPFILLHYIPFVKANRVPNRFSIMLSLTLAVLVAFGLFWIFQKLSRKNGRMAVGKILFATIIVSALILFEQLSVPLPLTNAAPPEIYSTIGQEAGDFTILQLPLGWRNSYGIQGTEKTILQSYQWVHHKRILGGNTSRNPDYKFTYFAGAPILSTIINMEEGKPSKANTDYEKNIAQEVLAFYNIRYVVIHRDYVKTEIENYVVSTFPLEKIYDDGSVAGYRVKDENIYFPSKVSFGTPISSLLKVRGWGADETAPGNITLNWATATQADLLLPLTGKAEQHVDITLQPYAYTGAPPQRAEIEIEGHKVADFVLAPSWNVYSFAIPANLAGERLAYATIKFTYAASPQSVEGSTDKRTLAAAINSITVSTER